MLRDDVLGGRSHDNVSKDLVEPLSFLFIKLRVVRTKSWSPWDSMVSKKDSFVLAQ